MAEEITYKATQHKYACGNDYQNIGVINFVGPGGSKLSAYSCNMNVDLDGEPQAYAPQSKPHLRPKDNLGNAGFRSAADNAILQKKYEAGLKLLAALEGRRGDPAAKAGPGRTAAGPAPVAGKGPVPSKAPVDPAMAALDKQIAHQKAVLRTLSFEHIDANGNHSKDNPKNFEKIFWKWYGVVALTPEQAKSAKPYLEIPALTMTLRRPVLDTTSCYEDVFGRFPVVQSEFEPGPEYFVTPLPRGANPRYPSWDQRYFIPADSTDQQPFGALATPLAAETGLRLNDMVFAIRLDTDDTLAFPFRDTGFHRAVAECSFATFTGLGGDYHPEKKNAAKFPNDFLLLYLAFPNKQAPAATLAKFSTASNAADFPVILSFIAQATSDTKAKRAHNVSGDPIAAFEQWKKTPSAPKPACFDVIVQGLSAAGSEFSLQILKRHPALNPGGPYLHMKP